MSAAARPRGRQHRTRCEEFRATIVVRQVPVDPLGDRFDAAGQHVCHHERYRVSARVFRTCETIDPLDDVEPAQCRVIRSDSLAFDYCVRVVVMVRLSNLLEEDRNVGSPVRPRGSRAGAGLGSGKNCHPLAPDRSAFCQYPPHSFAKALGDLHFTRTRVYLTDLPGTAPTGLNRRQDRDSTLSSDVDEPDTDIVGARAEVHGARSA